MNSREWDLRSFEVGKNCLLGKGTYILKDKCLKYFLINESLFMVIGIIDYQTKQQITFDIGKLMLQKRNSLVSN